MGPKIVAPLGHAVRFVYDKERHIDLGERAHEPRGREPFGGDIEYFDVAAFQCRKARDLFGKRQGGIDERRREVQFPKSVYLVGHEGDQGRNHERCAWKKQRRQLVTERFAVAGGHDGQAVAARKNRPHDVLLARPEF